MLRQHGAASLTFNPTCLVNKLTQSFCRTELTFSSRQGTVYVHK